MPNYRRWFVPGGTFFFTLVTCNRSQFLTEEKSRVALRNAIESVRKTMPFELTAMVLLPDHLHSIWTLPVGDDKYPIRWKRIKELFTRDYLKGGGCEIAPSESRKRHGERGVWQRRYWGHTIEDEDELKGCVDYVHWNPKKHGYVDNVCNWPWSSFHRYVAAGEYTREWERSILTLDMMRQIGANDSVNGGWAELRASPTMRLVARRGICINNVRRFKQVISSLR